MSTRQIIAPSILSADFTKLGEELFNVEEAGADWIHIDVMDGQFVPDITYGPIIVNACSKATNLILDVHLMIEKPDHIIPEFVKAGADYISVHQEACTHLHRSLQIIKNLDVKAGVALNPATPVSSIECIIDQLDFILIMSVNPGFGGQRFIKSTVDKIKTVSQMLKSKNSNAIIQVDGGINNNTIKSVSDAGATSFVAGSAIFHKSSYTNAIHGLRRNM